MKQLQLFLAKEFLLIGGLKNSDFIYHCSCCWYFIAFFSQNYARYDGFITTRKMTITLPASTSIDSWTQYYKNLPQFLLLAIVLLSTGIISTEVEKGTLIPFITKGLSRSVLVISKALYLFFIWTFTLFLSFVTNLGYTAYYFNDGKSPHLLLPLFGFWLYGSIILTATIFASSLAKNMGQSLLIVAVFYLISSLSGIFKKIDHYNPFILGTNSLNWLTGKSDFTPIGLVLCWLFSLSFYLLA